ncbi:hypothetical protein CC86DRAFT_367816 [Ophiobolus disseminans]|uniref:Uncharacterized protein n=1 Tax=Ophiobolus disseminans TaxID=1469910 RepID=A0A6A7ABD4_9PLEO|nr:hypothetical protein CC86DRAFT_367816 [Ophiobolus disseminans]
MAGIVALPTELLFHIFRYLHPSVEIHPDLKRPAHAWDCCASYRTLSALTRTCRQVHPVAIQVLYERYEATFTESIAGYFRRLSLHPSTATMMRHINIWEEGLFTKYKGLPPDELNEQLKHTQLLDDEEMDRTITREPAQAVLAILVARACNLEIFEMKARHRASKLRAGELPFWLLSVVEAAQQIQKGAPDINRYHQLHTMHINVQASFSPDFAHLFSLPSLRKLRLDDLGDFKDFRDITVQWPIQVATSNVHTLELVDSSVSGRVVASMITTCRELSHFKCLRAKRLQADGIEWCRKIVSALGQHASSLRTLSLDPGDTSWIKDVSIHYSRVQGLHQFHAMQSLTIPFMVLMGRPGGTYESDQWVSLAPEWKGYPQIGDTLPPKLQKLVLGLSRDMMSPKNMHGYEGILLSVFPQRIEQGIHPKQLNVEYHALNRHEMPLLDFDAVKKSYESHGVGCNLEICD